MGVQIGQNGKITLLKGATLNVFGLELTANSDYEIQNNILKTSEKAPLADSILEYYYTIALTNFRGTITFTDVEDGHDALSMYIKHSDQNIIERPATKNGKSVFVIFDNTNTITSQGVIEYITLAGSGVTSNDACAADAAGDPYVSPLYGDAYKLPDRAGNYRYVSTFSPYNRRFTIDADVRMLRKDEQADMLRYILAHNKDRVAELQGRVVLDGYFFRNYLLTNCGDKLRVDMEANTINHGPLRNMSTDAFTVRMGRREAQSVAPYHKEKNKVLYSITITTHHEAYGEIEVTLFKYANPQIRNGISMRTSRKMTRENAKGLILGYQPSKNFSIHKLGSKKDIVAYGEEAQAVSAAKKVMETFDYESSSKQAQIHFLQEQ